MTFSTISGVFVPLFIGIVLVYGLFKRVDVYQSFVEGAKKGLKTTFSIAPSLVTMLCAIAVFRESGALDALVKILSPFFSPLGLPAEIMPLVLLRPFSGSASLSMLSQILSEYGPDSQIGLLASTVMGSSETIFYTVAVYFGAVGVTKARYSVTVSLLSMIFGLLAASLICRLVFPSA